MMILWSQVGRVTPVRAVVWLTQSGAHGVTRPTKTSFLLLVLSSRNIACSTGFHSADFCFVIHRDWNQLLALALAEVEATLNGLPAPLREQARKLPVTFEPRPDRDLVADGVESDTLGLFVGPEFADEGAVPMPPQIVLFLENLWTFAEGDEEMFREEVHTTLLHELGHYLGLDEDDLSERGLE